MDSVIITTNDWSVQDILPKEYPYLLLEDNLESVENMIEKVKLTYNKTAEALELLAGTGVIQQLDEENYRIGAKLFEEWVNGF